MSTNLEKVETGVNKLHFNFSIEQVELIKNLIAKNATQEELSLFLYQCRRLGLDPLTKQIYFTKQKVGTDYRMVIVVGIDGFRTIAERSGLYAGQEEPVFITEDGNLIAAKVPVYKFNGSQRYLAAVGVAYYSEYMPPAGKDFMWKKMPHNMLAKVAEALALRKAFPCDLSGVYTTEEMEQAAVVETIELDPEPASSAAPETIEFLPALINECTSIPELTHLFHSYQNVFESNSDLKQKLTERKNVLKNISISKTA